MRFWPHVNSAGRSRQKVQPPYTITWKGQSLYVSLNLRQRQNHELHCCNNTQNNVELVQVQFCGVPSESFIDVTCSNKVPVDSGSHVHHCTYSPNQLPFGAQAHSSDCAAAVPTALWYHHEVVQHLTQPHKTLWLIPA